MTASSVFLAVTGIFLSFLPSEIQHYLDGNTNQITVVLLQIMGAAYPSKLDGQKFIDGRNI